MSPRPSTAHVRRPAILTAAAEVITEREQLKDIAGRFRVPPRLLAGSFAPTAVAAE